MEEESLIPRENIKQEPDYETVKNEANGQAECDMARVKKRARTSSTSLSCPDADSFLYCEKCQLKYERGCPEDGPLVYIDNAEVDEDQGFSQDLSPKDRQVGERKNALQSQVCEARFDDVRIFPDGDCSTKSDEMYSVAEENTEIPVTATSYELQSNVKIKTYQEIHKWKHFTCDVCGSIFAYCSQFKRHTRTHTGEKPYKCDVCSVGFAVSGDLKRHKKTHTGEKPYKCDVCGVGFAENGHLKRHTRTHTGEKPFKCDVCDAGFAENANLINHKRIHTGEKPYKCDVCGAEFSQSMHLKGHMRIHTGEKPYKCDVCGAKFSHSIQLKRHKTSHKGHKPN